MVPVLPILPMLAVDPSHPLVGAALRVLAGVFAAVVLATGLFGRSLQYALVVGLVVGGLYAVAARAGSRLTP